MCIWRGVIQQNISIVIQHLGVENRFCVDSAVCNRRIGCRQLNVINTILDTSKRLGLGILILISKSSKPKIEQIFITFFFAHDFCQCAYCTDVHRMFYRITYSCRADVLFVPVIDFLPVFVLVRFIDDRA